MQYFKKAVVIHQTNDQVQITIRMYCEIRLCYHCESPLVPHPTIPYNFRSSNHAHPLCTWRFFHGAHSVAALTRFLPLHSWASFYLFYHLSHSTCPIEPQSLSQKFGYFRKVIP